MSDPKSSELAQDANANSVKRLVIPRHRWEQLMKDDNLQLTTEEIKAGWHFCYEWDGLLIGPGMDETQCCTKACGCITGKHDGRSEPTSQDEAV